MFRVVFMEAYQRHDISDRVWELLKPNLPGQKGGWGRAAHDNRRFINAVLGSMAMLAGFYHSHQFTVNERISLPNIAKVSLMAAILVGLNAVYFDQGRPRPEVDIPWAHG